MLADTDDRSAYLDNVGTLNDEEPKVLFDIGMDLLMESMQRAMDVKRELRRHPDDSDVELLPATPFMDVEVQRQIRDMFSGLDLHDAPPECYD
jgi:hypothetical protein